MRTFPTLPSALATDLALAVAAGVTAGTVSAGLRWLIFRYEAKRRTKRMQDTLGDAARSFGAALERATKGAEQASRGGRARVRPATGGVDVTGPFVLGPTPSPAQLDQIFADLNRARRGPDQR